MILISMLLLSVASPLLPNPIVSSSVLEAATLPLATPNLRENTKPIFHALFNSTVYLGAGTALGSVSLLTGITGGVCKLTPWTSKLGDECLLSSQICGIASLHSFVQATKSSPLLSFFLRKKPSSHADWYQNKKLLSEIPAFTKEEKELLSFLQKHWLAKTTGCFPFFTDWMCPAFDISLQVHPESTNSYARLPSNNPSDTYKNRVETWKQILPHPLDFPLILTRPSNIQDYLPVCFQISPEEKMECSVKRLADVMQRAKFPIVVDLTSVLPDHKTDGKQWQNAWNNYEALFSQRCKEHQLDLNQIVCVHRVDQKNIGGLRLLPFSAASKKDVEKQYQFLLEWISRFGLSTNRIELDRSLLPIESPYSEKQRTVSFETIATTREQWISFLNSMESNWRSTQLHKTLMFKGTLQALKDLCSAVSPTKWEEIMRSPTRSSVVQLSFRKIKERLHLLIEENERVPFHETTLHIEQINADLSSLLEIFSPYTREDFVKAYREHLTCIPQELQLLTTYGIHSSGMTSLAGIFKAVEKNLGRIPRILYGENAYFECIHAAEDISKASSIHNATEEDWKEVDLILAQFNPTVKRINFKVTEYQVSEYHVENIAEVLHRALKAKNGAPLVIALDCTLDYSDSPRVGKLLTEFQHEIQRGDLNVICYRSGIKFDLFGMDNYCGAPFCMTHNQDPKWSSFNSLLTDPTLQTDLLSLNWFCLIYQHTTPYLELYRKQIFDNTRAVLKRAPSRLFCTKNTHYRIIPCDEDADPTFIDIKIFGPLHAIRGGLLVGVYLTLKSMQAGHPLLYRPSIGFYHPNLAVLFGTECTTVRLTLGLDPSQIDVIVRCLEKIDSFN